MAISEISIDSVAEKLNERADRFRMREFPEIRKSLTGFYASRIFDSRSIFPAYAFHVGGRRGLQFNIGVDGTDQSDRQELRYGVAFSLGLGRNLKSIEPLLSKIVRFNDYSRLYPRRFENLMMWYWNDDGRSDDFPPTPIRSEWVTPGWFIFVGQRQPINSLNLDEILSLFDELLPIYEYTEGDETAHPLEAPVDRKFEFRPGFTPRPDRTVASQSALQLDINLRHNIIQYELCHQLASH